MANPGPIYYVGMQPGEDAVYPAPVNHEAAEHTQPPAPMQMSTPRQPAGCPPGLEYLTPIDQILIHQKPQPLFRWKKNNVYFVKNSVGQQLFKAEEEKGSFWQPSNNIRPFTIHMHDNSACEVMTVIRRIEFECCFYHDELEVQSPPGNPIGYVECNQHLFSQESTILDGTRTPVLKIKSPSYGCMSDDVFDVTSVDGLTVVGEIHKEWRGFTFSTADHFGISFPMDLDVKIKAVLIGACFLIDFKYFEDND